MLRDFLKHSLELRHVHESKSIKQAKPKQASPHVLATVWLMSHIREIT